MSSRRGRGPGLSAFQNNSSLASSYAMHGDALKAANMEALKTQLSVFQSLVHNFALTHAEKIKQDPALRNEFHRMCTSIGVDPAAATNAAVSKKGAGGGGFFSMMAGRDDKEFVARVALRVVEVCRASREENGGLLGVEECRQRVAKGKGVGGAMDVTSDDVLRAVESLKPLSGGFSIITVGSRKMIRSIPKELSTDQSTVLEAIQIQGFVTVSMLEDNLNWENARAETVIEDLLSASLVWVDAKAPEKEYWSPAFMHDDD
ncbi:hypothetical protein MMC17_006525 [Xylographa soralifera]|nr:hypothetical protein [Xylographa soralifera]